MTKKQRQREHEARQMIRDLKLNQKKCKLAAAKICYQNGLFHYRAENPNSVAYWEREFRRNISEANSIGMGA